MIPRSAIALALLASFALVSAKADDRRTKLARRPNIVVIMFDDMSPRIGAFGDTVARTPNLDAFARQAIRYPNTFTAAPVCAPSRAALMSGRYQQTITAQHMRTKGAAGLPGGGPMDYEAVPPREVKYLPELLRRGGYHTVNIGKTDYQVGEPFTIWDDSGAQADWRKSPTDKPFFAFINLPKTHESYLWPEDLKSASPLVARVVARNRQELAGKPRLTDPARVRVPAFLPDTPVVRADIARMYDNIAFEERQVGRIMAELQARGVLDETVVVVSADHGDGLPRMKRAIYASGLRVPLMVRLPDGHGAGSEATRLVSFVDLAPTLLRLAGLPVPEWMHGKPFLGPGAVSPQAQVYAGADRFDEAPEWQRTVIDDRYQYVRNLRPDLALFRPLAFRDVLPSMQELWRLRASGGLSPTISRYFEPGRPREELYDLRADPDTVIDLARDPRHGGALARLRRSYERWSARVGDDSRLPEATMIAAIWPGNVQPATGAPVVRRVGRTISIASSTPGASVGWRRSGDDRWHLYVDPIRLASGETIEAKAILYGYAESPVVRYHGR